MLLGLATGAPAPKTYIEDVFSTYLYTGNASARSITNGIDCSSKKALTWIKERSAVAGSYQHFLFDTVRGAGNYLRTTQTAGQSTDSGMLSAFTSSGFSLGTTAETNVNNGTFVSWTFREAAKFFDVVTWTGDGVAGRQIPHSLGGTVGMVIVKKTSGADMWAVWHRGTTAGNYLQLESTAAQSSASAATLFGNGTITVDPSSTVITVGAGGAINANGSTYVAYVFAHDTSADGLIQCGTFTTDGSGNATQQTLGWEMQFALYKASSAVNNWGMQDSMRGLTVDSNRPVLMPNSSNAESSASDQLRVNATGFTVNGLAASTTYIYVAIRRGPMRLPTSGTQVYNATTWSGNDSDSRALTDVGFPPDMVQACIRGSTSGLSRQRVNVSRLIGTGVNAAAYLDTASTSDAQVSNSSTANNSRIKSLDQSGITVGYLLNQSYDGVSGAVQSIAHCFRRYPGVFDQVCYTGTGSTQNITHNLTVAPEMIIVKARGSAGYDWPVYHAALGNTKNLYLDLTGVATTNALEWNSTSPTSAVFTVRDTEVNNSGTTFTSYLFATLAGISKVGSYTGDGTTGRVIDCGFAAGARFVMIKRTDAVSGWIVHDTVRGIVAGNDPFLFLNDTQAEFTTHDTLDPASSGFIVNEVVTGMNTNGGTYIYLAIA